MPLWNEREVEYSWCKKVTNDTNYCSVTGVSRHFDVYTLLRLWTFNMTFTIRAACQVAIAATVAMVAVVPSAKAEDYGGWDYAKSSIKNGIFYEQIGGSTNPFEFYSLAMKDMGDRMVVAINANLNPNGGTENIAYGDMLFNSRSRRFGCSWRSLSS